MKKTSEEFMEWLGLKVGDRLRCKELTGTVFEVIKMDNGIIALDGLRAEWHSIHELIDKEIEILPAPKRVGNLKCIKEIKHCKLKGEKCPLTPVCIYIGETPYEKLENWKESKYFDQEIYDIIKDRLDKEVEE